MANARFYNDDGYGQLELNNAIFPRTGQVEAQCSCASVFTSALPLENGMLVVVDKPLGVVDLADASEDRPFGLVYTAEKLYDRFAPGLKNFYMISTDGFYPRIGYLNVGDLFTTNCVAADAAVYTTEAALTAALVAVQTTALYGAYTTDLGAIAISSAAPTLGPVLKVIKKTTMPDGQTAVQFQVASL